MNLSLAVRFAVRELRGGLRGFGVFLACIVLGVAAIAGVGSVARGMTEGIAREGRAILGGDIAVSLIQREASAAERAYLDGLGATSTVATLRAMARTDDGTGQALVELKAVDAAYPLVGAVAVAGGGDLRAVLAPVDGVAGALADAELLTRLGLAVGDRVLLGETSVRLAGVVAAEPDRLASGGFTVGPRLLVDRDVLAASGLVQPGSLVTFSTRIVLPADPGDAAVAAVAKAAETAFPEAAWRVQTRDNAAPGLRQNIQRFAEFLTLIGLTALVVGGVGVANAVASFLDGKRTVIATLKSLGAPATFTVIVHFIEIMAIALLGIAAGLVVGAAIPFLAGALLARIVPVAIAGVYPLDLGLAALYGILTAAAFALVPLGRAREVPPSALFRDQVAPSPARPKAAFAAAVLLAFALLAGLAVALAFDRRIALAFVGAVAGAFLLLRLVALGLMRLAARVPRSRSTVVRLAVGAIHRPGALTPSVVLSLGLGLTLLVALGLIDGNFRRELFGAIPKDAPSFFFLDIQGEEAAGLAAFAKAHAPTARFDIQPMLRGRIVKVDGVPADEVAVDPEARWVLRGDRGVTYAAAPPANNRIVEGAWWPADYDGAPLVSFEAEAARGLHLAIGDTVTVNLLGREVTATVASLRTLEWRSLSMNSVMVFSPNTFRGAPFTSLATLAWPDGGSTDAELAFLKAVTAAFPAVTVIRVKEAIETANGIVGDIGWAVRGGSAVTRAAAALVLGGAFAAGRRRRVHDAVVLKTLRATRGRLVSAYALGFLPLGGATAVFGIVAGGLAAWAVLRGIMDIPFAFLAGPAIGAAAVALLLTLVLGLAGTWRVLGEKAAPVLRNL
ncbi:MAG TPA: ABC transporter permease [Bauldia sp.]|nr:ABC transporter permease [Bauldia sp.]